MTWNNNDGPWGSSSGQKRNDAPKDSSNPWARKEFGSSGGSAPTPPPDFDAWMKSAKNWLDRYTTGGHDRIFVGIVLFLVFVWLGSGVYQVASNQVGVVMHFGAFSRIDQPGLRYHLPYPIEDVMLPIVTTQNEIPIGFRSLPIRGSDEVRLIPKPEESMMLTQDENIINAQFTVFWRVSDVSKFLFEIRNPETTIKMAAESAMREVIGQNKLQFALTEGRGAIAEEARTRLQALMDEYNAGIIVTQINLQTVSVPDEVKASFQDVVNARLDQERFQNQAEAHANKVIPEAKGQAAQIMQQAMGYRDQKVAVAQGDADRFKEVLAAYSQAREATAKRLYLETMESILRDAHKVIMDKTGSGSASYLPLNNLLRDPKASTKEEGASK